MTCGLTQNEVCALIDLKMSAAGMDIHATAIIPKVGPPGCHTVTLSDGSRFDFILNGSNIAVIDGEGNPATIQECLDDAKAAIAANAAAIAALEGVDPLAGLSFVSGDDEVITFVGGVVTIDTPDDRKCPRIDPATGDIVFDLVDEDGNVITSGVDSIDTGTDIGPTVTWDGTGTPPAAPVAPFDFQFVVNTAGEKIGCVGSTGYVPFADSDNQDASEVSFDPTGLTNITETNVQDALVGLDADCTAKAAAITALQTAVGAITDTDDQTAAEVSVDPTGLANITATDVQGALAEIDADCTAKNAAIAAGVVVGTANTAAIASLALAATTFVDQSDGTGLITDPNNDACPVPLQEGEDCLGNAFAKGDKVRWLRAGENRAACYRTFKTVAATEYPPAPASNGGAFVYDTSINVVNPFNCDAVFQFTSNINRFLVNFTTTVVGETHQIAGFSELFVDGVSNKRLSGYLNTGNIYVHNARPTSLFGFSFPEISSCADVAASATVAIRTVWNMLYNNVNDSNATAGVQTATPVVSAVNRYFVCGQFTRK